MDLECHSGAVQSIDPSRMEAPSNGDAGIPGKKKPVRRDPEKRRLQNIQAQKKYSEFLLTCSSVILHDSIVLVSLPL